MVSVILALLMATPQDSEVAPTSAASWHEFAHLDIDGKERKMSEYRGKVVLVVNVASKCGLTPQYKALEALHGKFKEQGFTVVGFPCNDFGSQEPGTEAEIKAFCTTNFGVTFPMYSKLHVKGPEAHPMYQWLVSRTGGKDIEWNFGKFLIGRNGELLARFGSRVAPDAPELLRAVEKAVR